MILNRLLGFQTSSAVFWKASLYPATFLRIPAEFHGSYVLSRHKSELCWRQGHCTRFLQPWDLAPEACSSAPRDPDSTLLLPRQSKSWQKRPSVWVKALPLCDFPSVTTKGFSPSLGTTMIAPLRLCMCWFSEMGREKGRGKKKKMKN